MASLNLSTNGANISKTYQSVVNAPPPSGAATASPTYGQWAVYSVHAPVVSAFQHDAGGKESVLKVQSAGEGELVDLIDEFSDGRIQFAYVKIKDPNSGLPKNALIGWCGEGVPERTKGYFTSHLAAVSKLLHGYHVQITARSDRDLTPESIVQKVADASGSNYSGGGARAIVTEPKPPVASKPAFTPTQSSTSAFKPLGGARTRVLPKGQGDVDEDGWGQDAPPVYRTQLEKVQPAYQPTKVNMTELTSQKPSQSQYVSQREDTPRDDVVRGGYQPIGKVDIAALRRQAKESGNLGDDRPTTVKGAYEPVGKVDIAAIRAKAQPPSGRAGSPPSSISPAATGGSEDRPRSMADRSAAFSASERLTSLPKPKVSNKFGGGSTFTGTKAPTPGSFGTAPAPAAAPVGTASRTFADQGGKTPAQIWAEKKARERGVSGSGDVPSPTVGYGGPTSPIKPQSSGEWKSGYTGKSWAPVQITHTGKSAGSSVGQHNTGPQDEAEEEAPVSPAGGISSIRDRFKDAPPMGAAAQSFNRGAPEPPPLDTYSKPNAGRGIPIPGLQAVPSGGYGDGDDDAPAFPSRPSAPRSPTPPTPSSARESSPIRVALPVGRGTAPEVSDAHDEQFSPPPVMPTRALEDTVPHERDLPEEHHDTGRGAAVAVAAAGFGAAAVATGVAAAAVHEGGGKRAIVQYDYEKAEENEIELKEGEYVINIDMVDEDWWMGENAKGESGLFPSNYVELVEDESGGAAEHAAPVPHAEEEVAPPPGPPPAKAGPTATAQYDYEAAEDNEISFPEGGKILNLEFPDEDWWMGEYDGKTGLFPANYVQLDE